MRRKPELEQTYIKAFNATGSFRKAAKLLEIQPDAIRMYFTRNGIKVRRIAVFKTSKGPKK